MSRFNLDAIAGQSRTSEVIQLVENARSLAWADPDSLHFEGKQAAQLLEVSRQTAAKAVGVARDQIAFATSTSEVVSAIIESVQPDVVIHSAIERQIVIDAISQWASPAKIATMALNGAHHNSKSDFAVQEIAVSRSGHISLSSLTEAIAAAKNSSATTDSPAGTYRTGTETPANTTDNSDLSTSSTHSNKVLVFVQWGNQEIGTIQDLAEIHRLTKQAGAELAVDATASLGFINHESNEPATNNPPWDFLFADAMSWGGSRMATIVAATGQLPIADTTSIAEAATATVTLETLRLLQPQESIRLADLRSQLEKHIRAQFPQADLVDPGRDRLPQVTTFSFPYVNAEALAVELDRKGVAIGSGSACATDVGVPSHVLAAVGNLTQGNVRVSLPIGADAAGIDKLVQLLPNVVAQLTSDVINTVATSSNSNATETTLAPANATVSTTSNDALSDIEIDERGQLCPHPVIELARAANSSAPGATVALLTDDPAALFDIPAWARLQQATIIEQVPYPAAIASNPATRFLIQLP